MLHRKSSRLHHLNYIGYGIYFLTICCDHRRPHLADPAIATLVTDTLLQSANTNNFSIHAYCLMPDHIHILVEGTRATAGALELIRHFKQRTSFAFKQQAHRLLWESSFYDHVLSAPDEIVEVARYIWWNPVRKGLCQHPGDYPFSGSQTFAWMQESGSASKWSAPWHAKIEEKARV